MSLAVNLWLVLVAAGIAPKCTAEDWAAEIERIGRAEIDKDWKDYVDKLGGEYEEVPKETPRNDEDDPRYLKEFLDWNPTSPREVPFLAILFTKDRGPSRQYKEYFKGAPDPGSSHIEPRTACGGALLSPKHVLTLCGCVSYLISETFEIHKLFNYYDRTPKYNILNQIIGAGKPPIVFVTFSLLRFVPDETYELDLNQTNWIRDAGLNCRRMIMTDGGTPDPQIRARRVDGQLIVIPFKPDIKIASYPIWPLPGPINKLTDPDYKERVIVASIGMRLTEKTKIKFYSSIQVSSLEMKHCNAYNELCDRRVFKEIDLLHTCFCPVTTNQLPQLVGGVIGWPVVNSKGHLVGLTATERRAADGTLVVAMLTNEHRAPLEQYIGKHILIGQNIPSILFRENELSKDFLIYDYWAAQFRTVTPRRRGFSGATKVDLNVFYFFLTFFVRLCFM